LSDKNHGITHHLGLIQTLGNIRDLQFLLHTNLFLACHKISGINHHKDGGHKISNNLHYCLLLLLLLLLLKTTLLQTMFLLRNLSYFLNLLQI
jgi:hypothetical protein